MAFDRTHHRKKGVLYSDLFKTHQNTVEEDKKKNIVQGSSSISSSSSTHSSPCGSSSSGFSTPFYSDDGGDFFIDELTRHMAERMLLEEEENEQRNSLINDSQPSSPAKSYVDNGDNLKNGINPASVGDVDRVPPIQVYELKRQPAVSKRGQVSGVKWTEPAQQKQLEKTTEHHPHHYRQYRGSGRNGSGMQAVFLGGPKSGSPGTGVFLPRVNTDSTDLKKKPGCSIVLMPTRVLQTLELHFKQRNNNSTIRSGGSLSLIHQSCLKDECRELEIERAANSEEMQLPQEWTY